MLFRSRHYRLHQQNKTTSTNSTASIFAWSRGLKHRAHLDGNKELYDFAGKVETAVVNTISFGQMTKDLALMVNKNTYLNTEEFIIAVKSNLN